MIVFYTNDLSGGLGSDQSTLATTNDAVALTTVPVGAALIGDVRRGWGVAGTPA